MTSRVDEGDSDNAEEFLGYYSTRVNDGGRCEGKQFVSWLTCCHDKDDNRRLSCCATNRPLLSHNAQTPPRLQRSQLARLPLGSPSADSSGKPKNTNFPIRRRKQGVCVYQGQPGFVVTKEELAEEEFRTAAFEGDANLFSYTHKLSNISQSVL